MGGFILKFFIMSKLTYFIILVLIAIISIIIMILGSYYLIKEKDYLAGIISLIATIVVSYVAVIAIVSCYNYFFN